MVTAIQRGAGLSPQTIAAARLPHGLEQHPSELRHTAQGRRTTGAGAGRFVLHLPSLLRALCITVFHASGLNKSVDETTSML